MTVAEEFCLHRITKKVFAMERKILPFYMTYPYLSGVKVIGEKDAYDEDVSYFEKMYPLSMKYVLREVQKTLALIDYDESMLYDEFPDEVSLYRLVEGIVNKIRNYKWDEEVFDEDELGQLMKLSHDEMLTHCVVPILFHEILKKRQNKRKK